MYIKKIFAKIVFLLIIVGLLILAYERQVFADDSPTFEEVYSSAYILGEQLAKEHGYYKGDFYIESECTAFLTKFIGDSPTSYLGEAFISGCQDGYKKYFGK